MQARAVDCAAAMLLMMMITAAAEIQYYQKLIISIHPSILLF
jgi:hypothetical protein